MSLEVPKHFRVLRNQAIRAQLAWHTIASLIPRLVINEEGDCIETGGRAVGGCNTRNQKPFILFQWCQGYGTDFWGKEYSEMEGKQGEKNHINISLV